MAASEIAPWRRGSATLIRTAPSVFHGLHSTYASAGRKRGPVSPHRGWAAALTTHDRPRCRRALRRRGRSVSAARATSTLIPARTAPPACALRAGACVPAVAKCVSVFDTSLTLSASRKATLLKSKGVPLRVRVTHWHSSWPCAHYCWPSSTSISFFSGVITTFASTSDRSDHDVEKGKMSENFQFSEPRAPIVQATPVMRRGTPSNR